MKSNHSQGARPRRTLEFTWTALLLGTVLSVIMGAANVYLGLKVGITVSASIPAAVIATGILQGILRRKSILEANLVQTGASAGESLAAGIIFTMPAMVLSGMWKTFDFWTTSWIALAGGLIGVLFMIPMRRVFVVESEELKFPEGVACAEVLRAGEGDKGSGTGTAQVFEGLAAGGLFKVGASYLGLFKSSVEGAIFHGTRVFYLGADTSPALLAVGLIIGLPIASQIFFGGAIGWIIIIPFLMANTGAESAVDEAYRLWTTQVKYVGVGAMVVGGIVSIWKVRRSLVAAVRELGSQYQGGEADLVGGKWGSQVARDSERKVRVVDPRHENLRGRTLMALTVVCVALLLGVYHWMLYESWEITLLVTVIMVVMAFFFTAVASYIVGLVGSSNSPVSGMTITTILFTGLMLYLFGFRGAEGIVATLGVAGVVCCVACTSGDICNDLKTGYLVGASPRKQQIMQILGVVVAAFVMAPVMTVLHEGSLNNGLGGIGGRDLTAPQAVLFTAIVNGFFGDGSLPWPMVEWGLLIGVLLLAGDAILAQTGSSFRLHVMPVAVGIYLPLGLSVSIMIGGILAALLGRTRSKHREIAQRRSVLIASGMIAGESLVGVFLAFLAYMEITSLTWGEHLGDMGMTLLTAGTMLMLMAGLYTWSRRRAS